MRSSSGRIIQETNTLLTSSVETISSLVDKTNYLAYLDTLPPFIIFRRPPLFGKSSWLSVLGAYFDILTPEEKRKTFHNLEIGNKAPSCTFLIMLFDFSATTQTVRNKTEGERVIRFTLSQFTEKYRDIVGDVDLDHGIEQSMTNVLFAVKATGKKVGAKKIILINNAKLM